MLYLCRGRFEDWWEWPLAFIALQGDLLGTYEETISPLGSSRYLARLLYGARCAKMFWLGLYAAGLEGVSFRVTWWRKAIVALNSIQLLFIAEYWGR